MIDLFDVAQDSPKKQEAPSVSTNLMDLTDLSVSKPAPPPPPSNVNIFDLLGSSSNEP